RVERQDRQVVERFRGTLSHDFQRSRELGEVRVGAPQRSVCPQRLRRQICEGVRREDGEVCAKVGGRTRALCNSASDAQDVPYRGIRGRRSGVTRLGMSLTMGTLGGGWRRARLEHYLHWFWVVFFGVILCKCVESSDQNVFRMQ
ncbi:unnamed protein product, partial [Ectocarpus sp. 13 AM-2016]